MSDFEFRVLFDNQPASASQSDLIEQITVDQEADMAWEAHIRLPIYTDDTGKWTGESERFMRPFIHARVEVKTSIVPFVPLIDGPVVGLDTHMSTEPGQSAVELIVRDDSVYLDREEEITVFNNMLDHDVASQVFGNFSQVASQDVETTQASPASPPYDVVQRGTAMQLLRMLARRNGMHAYVLPGDKPGNSIGCFKSFPTKADGSMPTLVLLGEGRNVDSLDIRYHAYLPSKATASSLSAADKTTSSATSSFGNVQLMGDDPPFADEADTATQVLRPSPDTSTDVNVAVAAETERSCYDIEAAGNVLGEAYQGVLQPYRAVAVAGINARLSGDYLITKVTHTITRSSYSQSFIMKRNAMSAGAGGTTSPGGIF